MPGSKSAGPLPEPFGSLGAPPSWALMTVWSVPGGGLQAGASPNKAGMLAAVPIANAGARVSTAAPAVSPVVGAGQDGRGAGRLVDVAAVQEVRQLMSFRPRLRCSGLRLRMILRVFGPTLRVVPGLPGRRAGGCPREGTPAARPACCGRLVDCGSHTHGRSTAERAVPLCWRSG